MKAIVSKILKSGLVEKHTAQLLEQWGSLPDGSTELVKNVTIQDLTEAQLIRLVEDISEELESSLSVKETVLDLDKLQWPVEVSVIEYDKKGNYRSEAKVSAVEDNMGNMYFRADEAPLKLLIPGNYVCRANVSDLKKLQTIASVDPMYMDQTPICYRVTFST